MRTREVGVTSDGSLFSAPLYSVVFAQRALQMTKLSALAGNCREYSTP